MKKKLAEAEAKEETYNPFEIKGNIPTYGPDAMRLGGAAASSKQVNIGGRVAH